MAGTLKTILLFPLLLLGLLAPKVSALALHLNPNISAIPICTGTEIVTIYIGRNGQPVEIMEADQSPCLLTEHPAETGPGYTRWTQAPRSYRAAFIEIEFEAREQTRLDLLPDLRGPPFVI